MNDPISKLYYEFRKRIEREMEEAFGRLWRVYACYPSVIRNLEIPALTEATKGASQYWRPATDVFETEEELILRLEIAGLGRDSLRISQTSDGRQLWLQGERREEPRPIPGQQWYHQLEIYFGAFDLYIHLPSGIHLDLDQIQASYHQGILILRIGKKGAHDAQRKRGSLSITIE